jgi:hypothetical protein
MMEMMEEGGGRGRLDYAGLGIGITFTARPGVVALANEDRRRLLSLQLRETIH